VRGALGLDPELVLDPCLQFPVRPEGEWQPPDEPYAAVYGHSFSDAFGEQVRRWARDRGCLLVSIGYHNAWADRQWIAAGPHEFAHCIAHARAVATNFFHGCVFALRNARPFVCETSAYRSIKVQNLMATLRGEKHLVCYDSPPDAYDCGLEEPLDPAILHRIAALRQQSDAYLDRALA
jgi:hypothetical protein